MSVLGTILTAVKTRIETLTDEPPVSIRKRVNIKEGEVLPSIVVAPLGERVVDQGFGGHVTMEYRVGVALITAGNNVYDDDLLAYLDTWESIRKKVFDAGYAGYDVRLDEATQLDLTALSEGYDAGLMVLRVRSAEDRN